MSDNIDPIRSGDERHERDLNRHRVDEQRRATAEARARLADREITVPVNADSSTVVALLDAVEAFERAVEMLGGDLMVDTPPARQPDNPQFVLPRQAADETVDEYTARIRAAADRLMKQQGA